MMSDTTTTPEEDLFFASVTGDLERAKKAIENGANVNRIDADGSTALMLAATTGNAEIVRLLLEHGADPGIEDSYGSNAEMLAEDNGYPDLAATIKGYMKAGSPDIPRELEEVSILTFVDQKAQELKAKLDKLGKESSDELVNEVNNLNILLFSEAKSFYGKVDSETNSAIYTLLSELNGNFEKLSKETDRKLEKVDVAGISDENIKELLVEDETMLVRITERIYRSLVKFLKDSLGIEPDTVAVKYDEYHKRLLDLRDALLSSMRSMGTPDKKPEGEGVDFTAFILGKRG